MQFLPQWHMFRRKNVSLRENCIKLSQSDIFFGDTCHSGYVTKFHWHTRSDTYSLSDTTFQRQKMCHSGNFFCSLSWTTPGAKNIVHFLSIAELFSHGIFHAKKRHSPITWTEIIVQYNKFSSIFYMYLKQTEFFNLCHKIFRGCSPRLFLKSFISNSMLSSW